MPTTSQISTAPGAIRRVRPPTPDSAPSPGAVEALADPVTAVRPTARQRPLIAPLVWQTPQTDRDFPVEHPYVRRFWTAALGPGAVADLLRLATAARRGRSLRRPTHLGMLVTVGLVCVFDEQRPGVVTRVPVLPTPLRLRLTPPLRREHAAYCA